jgi:hypothetical protein
VSCISAIRGKVDFSPTTGGDGATRFAIRPAIRFSKSAVAVNELVTVSRDTMNPGEGLLRSLHQGRIVSRSSPMGASDTVFVAMAAKEGRLKPSFTNPRRSSHEHPKDRSTTRAEVFVLRARSRATRSSTDPRRRRRDERLRCRPPAATCRNPCSVPINLSNGTASRRPARRR